MSQPTPTRLVSLLALVCASVVPWAAAGAGPAAAPKYEDGKYPPPKPPEVKWVDLLAGKLEDHWSDMNCSLDRSFKLTADDKSGDGSGDKATAVLAGSGHPIGLVRSMRPYENFILEVDWRHLTEASSSRGGNGTTGNSGLYVWADPIPPPGNSFTRAIEVQVCNLGNGAWYTSHGDLFPIHGATMVPDPRFGVAGSRSMPIEFRGHKTGQWNHCRITCADGTVQEEFNGALVSAGFRSSPRKGYLCLESEGGPVEFRNMRLTELAGDPALKPEQTSLVLPEGTRTTCLFNGLDLAGWSAGEGQAGEVKQAGDWAVEDRILRCAGRSKGEPKAGEPKADLSRPLSPGEFTLILDWARDAKKATDAKAANEPKDAVGKDEGAPFTIDGLGLPAVIPAEAVAAGGWNRAEVQVSGGKVDVSVNGKKVVAGQAVPEGAAGGQWTLRLLNPGHPVRFCNLMRLDAGVTKKKS